MVNDQDSVPQHYLLRIFIAFLSKHQFNFCAYALVSAPGSLQAKGPAKGIPVAEEAHAIERCEFAFRI